MDILTPKQRSERMRMVLSSSTKPELFVQKIVKSLGYAPNYNAKELPGTPDIVFKNKKKAIFVHGCFWHGHTACRQDHKPRRTKSKRGYWDAKLEQNRLRDARAQRQLNRKGWSYLVIWECQLRNKKKTSKLIQKLRKFLR